MTAGRKRKYYKHEHPHLDKVVPLYHKACEDEVLDTFEIVTSSIWLRAEMHKKAVRLSMAKLCSFSGQKTYISRAFCMSKKTFRKVMQKLITWL